MVEFDFSEGIKQYKAIIDGGEADFIPVTTQMAEFCMKYGGHSGREFFSNPELFVRGSLQAQKELGFDVPDMVWDVYSVEAEALGGRMVWFDDMYPALDNSEPIIGNEKDLARIKPPDPFKSARMPWVLEALGICKELTGYTHYIHYCAPFNLAAQVMRFENLVLAIRDNPRFVHKLMNFLVEEVLAPYVNAYFKVFPDADIANGKDAVGSLPFITEDILEEFSVPYILKLRELCGDRPGVRCDNWWGDSLAGDLDKFWKTKLMVTPQYLKVQDPDCFRVGTRRIREFADKEGSALSFGVGTLLLQNGPPEEIVKRIHEYLEVGGSGPLGKRFYLYLCSFSAETPVEHVRVALDAVRRFRDGDRPYASQVFSGPDGVAAEMDGGKGFMGIGTKDAPRKDRAPDIGKEVFQSIYQSVIDLDEEGCSRSVTEALEAGEEARDILDHGLIPPVEAIGDMFASGEMFVPEMLMGAKAMKAGLEVLKPVMAKGGSSTKGTIVLATVFGDLHDIGKNLVGMMLEGAGFGVVDLGVNIDAPEIVEAARKADADLIGLSALLTTTMPYMKRIIVEIRKQGLDIPIIVGGAPVSQEFADMVGADGYGDNAPEAVTLAKTMCAGG